jgi:16S rRNA (adenine1518-N6/adenine1519-N6)-dimethyltransferase
MKLLQKAKKSLGQNFLMDNNIINKIVEIGRIDKNKTVMEIGAGYGNLTKTIASMGAKKIFAIEKDKKLVSLLKEKFKNYNNIKIINRDILNIIEENKLEQNVIVFGNLPYNISTKILASLILLKKWPPWYEILILMFQKEVAERIIAKAQTKEFGRLSILSNWRLEIKKHFNVSNNCFFPKPKITSTVLSFKPKKNNRFNLKNPKNLEKVTRILFSNRRKIINKNFNKLFKQNKLVAKNLNINLNQRPEELSSEIFYKIALQYEKLFD